MDADVLVVGAGPVGLMTAIELRRRGVDVVIVDERAAPAQWAKAVGVQPRTLEVWDAIGLARSALDASITLRGQLAFVNGEAVGRLDLALPDDVPYRFVALPQYETERLLADHLANLGTTVRRGCRFLRLTQDGRAVTATLADDADPLNAETTLTTSYLVGCDGAHSLVRKALGLAFEGDAFPEEYMLADVEVDWTMPAGYGVRATHQTEGVTDDLLVCIPLPGVHRYRMSMLAPDELATPRVADGEVAHGLEGGRRPELHHIQAVLDRLAPQPTTASRMRWSSVFRISHRLVDRYHVGRVFVAGDAAHIHPPTGAQGMNTGLQDAYNLGWKLALAVHGAAADGLLETYHTERHPVGEEVVGRTVRSAREGIGAGETTKEAMMLREAQLLVAYPDSPIVGDDGTSGLLGAGPRPGERAPDAGGLRQPAANFPLRLHELLRHPDHTLLLWAGDEARAAAARPIAAELAARTSGRVRSHLIVAADVAAGDVSGSSLQDADGHVARAYGFDGPGGEPTGGRSVPAYLVRPDGYVAYRSGAVDRRSPRRPPGAHHGDDLAALTASIGVADPGIALRLSADEDGGRGDERAEGCDVRASD